MIGAKALCALVVTEAVMLGGFGEVSHVTAEELESGLLYELKPMAGTFVEIEKEYGINSVLYASMVALESGWARSELSEVKNNITSFTDGNGLKEYESKEECLWDMARNLSENYLDEDGIYYNGGSNIEDVACYYLIGKPLEDMNESEKKRTEEYIESVKGIQSGIAERIEQNIDNGCESAYNDNNNTKGGMKLNKEEFGKQLRSNRTEQGKTQTDCAKACGVCLEAYQKWERGLSFPREDKFDRIYECLGVKANEN